MYRHIIKIIFLASLQFCGAGIFAQNSGGEKIVFFTDRQSCVSGDTVWFATTLLQGNGQPASNIVHVQLDGYNNRHITKSIIQTEGIYGSGYLAVPDSLATGTYSLKAFTNIQKNKKNDTIAERLLVVYNRFDGNLEVINLLRPENTGFKQPEEIGFGLKTDKISYQAKENIRVSFEIPEPIKTNLADLVVGAELFDPLASAFSGEACYGITLDGADDKIVAESGGVILSGQVTETQTNAPAGGATVMLSISDSIPYFDYYYTGPDGIFHFFLKQIKGLADLVLQVAPETGRQFKTGLFENYIDPHEMFIEEQFIPDDSQKEFAKKLVDASRFRRYFFPGLLSGERRFSKPSGFEYPFYGQPTYTVYTRDYYDLPNFKEISRELLTGAKYRERKDTMFIKILNEDRGIYFPGEPFKLLDGIPVFDTRLFSNKNSADIDRIDILTEERLFGDLKFNGVISVYSPKPDLSWVNNHPGLSRSDFQTIQFPAGSGEVTIPNGSEPNIPDLRQVLFWNRVEELREVNQLTFRASDLTGPVIIHITAVTTDGRIFNENRKIEIK